MTNLTKGTRVRHASKPDWGVGQLLDDANKELIRVFFEDGGQRNLAASMSDRLIVVTGDLAASLLLDNLNLPKIGEARLPTTISQAKQDLQKRFPGGLHGERMQREERSYKDDLSTLCRQWYEPLGLQAALTEGRHNEVLDLAARLVKHKDNNFPSHFDSMPFTNGIKTTTRVREFAEAFVAWVAPEQPLQAAFEAFARELDHLGCAKWPILTAYRFLLHPQTDVLIKPTNLCSAAEMACFEINYQPHLNWLTYQRTMDFYRHVRTKIADLQPRDMIDVQNFIWCIDPQYGGAS